MRYSTFKLCLRADLGRRTSCWEHPPPTGCPIPCFHWDSSAFVCFIYYVYTFYGTIRLNGFLEVGGIDFKPTDTEKNGFLPRPSQNRFRVQVSAPSGLVWWGRYLLPFQKPRVHRGKRGREARSVINVDSFALGPSLYNLMMTSNTEAFQIIW